MSNALWVGNAAFDRERYIDARHVALFDSYGRYRVNIVRNGVFLKYERVADAMRAVVGLCGVVVDNLHPLRIDFSTRGVEPRPDSPSRDDDHDEHDRRRDRSPPRSPPRSPRIERRVHS